MEEKVHLQRERTWDPLLVSGARGTWPAVEGVALLIRRGRSPAWLKAGRAGTGECLDLLWTYHYCNYCYYLTSVFPKPLPEVISLNFTTIQRRVSKGLLFSFEPKRKLRHRLGKPCHWPHHESNDKDKRRYPQSCWPDLHCPVVLEIKAGSVTGLLDKAGQSRLPGPWWRGHMPSE